MYKMLLKPFFDRIVALIALIILIPFFIIVSFSIKLDSKGPIFFLQERLGRNGRVFKMIKFRSMKKNSVPVGSQKVFENDIRITRVGGFIRKTSVDELPQLINILIGDMSFIGPRPPVPSFPKVFDEYNEYEKQRFLVKPGLSGLVQIRHREINDWNINIPVDVEYVLNYGFLYDMKLFFRSFVVFFKTNDIYTRK